MVVIQRQVAQQVLTQFQDNPDAWQRVPKVLEESSHPQAKASHQSIVPRANFSLFCIIVSWVADSGKTHPDTLEDVTGSATAGHGSNLSHDRAVAHT